MRYVNGKDVLPEALLDEIRKHVEGVYVYIPKNDTTKTGWGGNTNFKKEMEYRNLQIYDKFLSGVDASELAKLYCLSVKSIRRILLEKKREMEPKKKMIRDILKQWNLEGEPVPIFHSTWSLDDRYVIKEYKELANLKRNISMFKTLFQEGVPVPNVVQMPDGRDFFELDDMQYVVTTKLSGNSKQNISDCNDPWFFEFGTILADLHVAFQECEKTISYWNNSLLEEMNGWVRKNLSEYDPKYLNLSDVEETIQELEQVYAALPKQLIHRDVHLGNFLFEGHTFSGYVDFDLSQSNIRIFDICYFLLGLLCEETKFGIDKERWFDIVDQVFAGYHSILPLNQEELRAVACVMKSIELLFVAYFLRIGDEKLSEDAGRLFHFISEHESRLKSIIAT